VWRVSAASIGVQPRNSTSPAACRLQIDRVPVFNLARLRDNVARRAGWGSPRRARLGSLESRVGARAHPPASRPPHAARGRVCRRGDHDSLRERTPRGEREPSSGLGRPVTFKATRHQSHQQTCVILKMAAKPTCPGPGRPRGDRLPPRRQDDLTHAASCWCGRWCWMAGKRPTNAASRPRGRANPPNSTRSNTRRVVRISERVRVPSRRPGAWTDRYSRSGAPWSRPPPQLTPWEGSPKPTDHHQSRGLQSAWKVRRI
jgi:hypothetical protein